MGSPYELALTLDGLPAAGNGRLWDILNLIKKIPHQATGAEDRRGLILKS